MNSPLWGQCWALDYHVFKGLVEGEELRLGDTNPGELKGREEGRPKTRKQVRNRDMPINNCCEKNFFFL